MTREDMFLAACVAVSVLGVVGWWLYGTVDHSGDLQAPQRRRLPVWLGWTVGVVVSLVFVAFVVWLYGGQRPPAGFPQ